MKKDIIPIFVPIVLGIIVSLTSFVFVSTTSKIQADQEKLSERVNISEKIDASLIADNVTLKDWLSRVEKKLDNALYYK